MRLVHVYLIGYFLLVFGAGLALWQAGILERVSVLWTVLTISVAVLLGLLLAYTSSLPSKAPEPSAE